MRKIWLCFSEDLIGKQIAKVHKLIKTINEKDKLLEKKGDLPIDETKKNDKLEKALAHEKEK
jgi:hypothetical protein